MSAIVDDGYILEFKVPINSLPYPPGKNQIWNFNISRVFTLDGTFYRSQTQPYDRSDPCWVCQVTDKLIMKDIVYSGKTELLPYISSNISGQRQTGYNDPIEYGKVKGEVGIGLNYDFSPSSSIEATINPDFSQIEADETQIDVNSTTALRYPERRIFFNEGADFLNTDSSAVYTRAINSPSYALKIYNRGDKHSYYFLDAEDEQTQLIIPGVQKSYSAMLGKSHANIFSYQYNIDNGQYISFLSTNRSYEDGGNGFLYLTRGLFLLDEKYALRFELAESQTDEPTNDLISTDDFSDDYTYQLDGESFNGYSAMLAMSRSTENWFTNLWIGTKSPNFRTDLGFTTENNWIANNLRHEYRFRSSGLIRSGEIGISTKFIHAVSYTHLTLPTTPYV